MLQVSAHPALSSSTNTTAQYPGISGAIGSVPERSEGRRENDGTVPYGIAGNDAG